MLDATNRQRSVVGGAEYPSVAPEAWREGIDFRIFLGKVRQRKSMIARLALVGFLGGLIAGVAYGLVRTPKFSASSELLITNTTLQLSGPDAVVTQILVENSVIQSAIEMLKSSSVLDRVIDRFGLDKVQDILPKSRIAAFGAKPEQTKASRRQVAVALLRSNMSVRRVGSSQVISILGTALTATDAAKLTNEIAQAFVQEQNDTSAVVTTNAALRERIKVLGPTAKIISEAAPPNAKDGPRTSIAMLLGALLGAALGIGGGGILTLLDRRLRSAEQLATLTSVECFGYVPQIKGRRMAWLQNGNRPDPASLLASSVLRRARSAVLERSERTPHVVGITSCLRGEGKTTLAAKWAKSIANEGSRVLFIDGCRDAVTLSSKSGQGAETQGLHEMLRGEAAPGKVIQAGIWPHIDFLPGGKPAGNLDALWGNLADLINGGSEASYQWVILDLPPLATAADARAAGQIVDDLLIVVEWGRASESQFEQALRALGPVRDRVIGTVINKTPWRSLRSEALMQVQTQRRTSAGACLRNPDGKGLL